MSFVITFTSNNRKSTYTERTTLKGLSLLSKSENDISNPYMDTFGAGSSSDRVAVFTLNSHLKGVATITQGNIAEPDRYGDNKWLLKKAIHAIL